jgi:heat shock protein HslJ
MEVNMKTYRLSTILLLVSVLLLSACAAVQDILPETGPTPGPEPAPTLAMTSWTLVSYGELGAEAQVIDGTEVTLEFQDDTLAAGLGGCNSFGAQYEATNGDISFTEIVSTLIACEEEGVMEQEEAYFQALENAKEFELMDGELRIWYDNRQRVLNFEEAR